MFQILKRNPSRFEAGHTLKKRPDVPRFLKPSCTHPGEPSYYIHEPSKSFLHTLENQFQTAVCFTDLLKEIYNVPCIKRRAKPCKWGWQGSYLNTSAKINLSQPRGATLMQMLYVPTAWDLSMSVRARYACPKSMIVMDKAVSIRVDDRYLRTDVDTANAIVAGLGTPVTNILASSELL